MAAVRDVCEARSLPHTCDDSWGGDIIAAACVHVAATVHPRLLDGVWIAEPFHEGPLRPGEPGPGRGRSHPGADRARLGVVPDDGALGDPVASFA
ncbi:hypothetical protein [Pseudonocardia sp. NPDC046786]|uniref:hypothetical protein n=1 Tax=Pseudonocardia sp. NPDC046786 TaxID=3155471 RepID=UPI003408AE4B